MNRVLSALALVATASAASAADLPVRTAPPPAPAPVVFSWTGFYAGVHAGAITRSGDGVRGASLDPNGLGAAFAPSFASYVDALFPARLDSDATGPILGGQIGYNRQLNRFLVVGAEADLSWTSLDADTATTTALLVTPPPGVTVLPPIPGTFSFAHRSQMDWFGTLRLRAGVAQDRLLAYVTGGLAVGGVEHGVSSVDTIPGRPDFRGVEDETRVGWTIGGGLEYAWSDDWTVRAEYLYYDLGETTVVATDPAFAGQSVSYTLPNDGHVARLALNRLF